MLVLGIILVVISTISLIIVGITSDDTDNTGMSIFGTLCLVLGILFIIGGSIKDKPTEKSLKENTLRIEVRSIYVNGKETKSDTVYIFTPKEN